MRTDGSDRAVSTVLDVALALLLVTASILLIGFYLNAGDDGDLDERQADRTAETLSGSTVTVGYSVEGIEDSNHYEEPEAVGSYDRTTYGPAVGLLAEAAVTNATIDGDPVILYADSFTDSVGANIESRLIGADHRVYVVATWQPYENGSIGGTATVGERPLVTEDTTAVTMTASSGMPAVDSAELAEAYAEHEDTEDLAEPIARSIVRGYFPLEQSQLALERQTLDRAVKTTHYLEMAEIVGLDDSDGGLDRNEPPLRRSGARADEANRNLIDGLTELIADDLESGPIGEELDEIGDDEAELEALFEETIAPGDVDVTVYTWDP